MNQLFFFTAIVLLLLVSCKKNELGGKSSITGKVLHHSKAVARAAVFIKFNAKEFPGADTTVYDEKVMADENGNYSINCYKGNYYLYGFGYDFAIPAPYIVDGGIPVSIRNREDLIKDLAVGEEQ
jgi:hypothetical protein